MARINYTRAFTATSYVAELTNVNDAADTQSDSLAVEDTEEGPWSRTLTMTNKGTYRFKVHSHTCRHAGRPGGTQCLGDAAATRCTHMLPDTHSPLTARCSSPLPTSMATMGRWRSRSPWCWACQMHPPCLPML